MPPVLRGVPALCRAGTAARGSRSPQPSGHRPHAGRCCPSKPCSNGPRSRSQPRQIRQHRGPERGALSCLWAPAPEPRGLTQGSSLGAQGQCPRRCLHPLSSACVLGPLPHEPHLHRTHISLPAIPQTWLPWVPLLRQGSSWPGGLTGASGGPQGAAGVRGPTGCTAAAWPCCPLVLEQLGRAPCVPVTVVLACGWDGCPGSQCPWCRVGVGWMSRIPMPLVQGWGSPGLWCDPRLLAAGAWPSMCTRRR